MNATDQQDALELRLRATLHTVAGTIVDEGPGTAPRRSPRRRLRIALGAGAVAVPVALAAAAVVASGPEYVDTIPPERIVTTGSVDGSRYLLVESARTGECGEPVTGVELVEERENLLGSEWNTSGYEYGEQVERRCGGELRHVNDTSRYLADPALHDGSGTEVGDSFVWVYAVHPDVDTVRITSGDYAKDLEVYEVDGAGYAPFEIPEELTEYTSVLLVDGRVVPGSARVREVPSAGG
jgi:hypothetical protein